MLRGIFQCTVDINRYIKYYNISKWLFEEKNNLITCIMTFELLNRVSNTLKNLPASKYCIPASKYCIPLPCEFLSNFLA